MTIRVAFIAGTLAPGGSERQMWYLAKSLGQAGQKTRLCSLTRDAYYETEFRRIGIEAAWVGRFRNPVARVASIVSSLRAFRPHVVQSMHSFANLYAVLAARALGAMSFGALRCDLRLATKDNGRWTPWLVRTPDALIVNSERIREQVIDAQLQVPDRVYYVANRIDSARFDITPKPHTGIAAIFVGRLLPSKRLDCFLRALAIARTRAPELVALVAGDGSQLEPMRGLAAELGVDQAVTFLGMREDLPAWLAKSDMLVMASDSEGSPNVILESMAAGLPVITTPAGDADRLVRHGTTGFIVPFGDAGAIASHMVTLAGSRDLRRTLGEAARRIVTRDFGFDSLSAQYTAICRDVGARSGSSRFLAQPVGENLG